MDNAQIALLGFIAWVVILAIILIALYVGTK